MPLKRLINTNFTTADEAASNVLKLALDRDRNFADAGGKAFAWGLEEVPLTMDAQNAKYCSELWWKSMTWAGLGEKIPLNGQEQPCKDEERRRRTSGRPTPLKTSQRDIIERHIASPTTPLVKDLQTYLTTWFFSGVKENPECSVRDRRSLLDKVSTELYRHDR